MNWSETDSTVEYAFANDVAEFEACRHRLSIRRFSI